MIEVKALTAEVKGARKDIQDVAKLLGQESRKSWWHRRYSAALALLFLAAVLFFLDLRERDEDEREHRATQLERQVERECESSNATRADIRASIVETVVVIIERTEDPDEFAPLVGQIQERLAETIPDRPC